MSGHLISAVLVPVGGFYLIVMGVLAVGQRLHGRGSARGAPAFDDRALDTPALDGRVQDGGRRSGWLARRFPPGWPAFAAQVTATVIGGYLLLMAVLTAYYYGVSRVRGNFLVSAWTGCAMLAGLALPVFATVSWLTWRRAGRPARPAGPPPALPPPAPKPPAGPEPVPD
jgi:Family of unknown function (DUF6256)